MLLLRQEVSAMWLAQCGSEDEMGDPDKQREHRQLKNLLFLYFRKECYLVTPQITYPVTLLADVRKASLLRGCHIVSRYRRKVI